MRRFVLQPLVAGRVKTLGMVGLLLLVGSASAATLTTPLVLNAGGDFVECVTLNAAPKPTSVSGVLLDAAGNLATGSPTPVALSAGAGGILTFTTTGGEFYCRFTGSKSSLRAQIRVTSHVTFTTTFAADAR